jgi:2-oxo-3-hexenedioate decarboxylase/2-keto-4-pentenoate hydratase
MSIEAANYLLQARHERRRLEGLPTRLRPADIPSAYDIQAAAQKLLIEAAGSTIAGYKIGCTTAVMQAFLKISSPCFGIMATQNVLSSPARLHHAAFLHVGVECEIAVRLKKPLLWQQAPFSAESVRGAVGGCLPAIEIVDDRWDNFSAVDTPTLIADNFFHAACVLGPETTDWEQLDLAAVAGTTVINGTAVGSGRGADVMGHPFAALAWLANALAARGENLPKGAVVLTGSVVETRWVAAGDQVVVDLAGLGQAEVRFATG